MVVDEAMSLPRVEYLKGALLDQALALPSNIRLAERLSRDKRSSL
jgi:hypothetical protein